MDAKMTVLASEICKAFEFGDLKIEILNGVNLETGKGEPVAISGKAKPQVYSRDASVKEAKQIKTPSPGFKNCKKG